MKRYYNKEETPLAFHKFVWFVSLPLSFISIIVRTCLELAGSMFITWGHVIDIVFAVIALSLIITCFIGFFKWKAYAWYGLMAYFSVLILYSAAVVVIYVTYDLDAATEVGQLVGQLIYVILVGIYYIKRRPLFFPKLQAEGAADTIQAPVMDDTATTNPTQNPSFCHECGKSLSKDGNFCGSCGTPVIR